MSRTMNLLKETYTLDLGVVSRGVDACVRRFCEELPFRVHEFKSGSQCWGWTVPMDWSVQKATIVKDGLVVYDGTTHPLGVWGYSRSFQGTLGVEELRRHLAYSEDWEDALVYHGALYYRPHIEDWGFSVPRSLFDALEEGEYQVDLRTELKPGTLKVLDFVLPGTSPETVVLNAHNCHAAQANDDMSGCVVGVEVMRRLQARSNYYTYRLLICPELYGVIFFLNNLSPEERAVLKYGIMLKSVGNVEPLSLQKSFTGDTDLDRAAVHVFSRLPRHGRIGAFRTVYGNDEIVFEAPGFEIPSVSLTRYPTSMPSAGRFPVPFREYHTSKDTHEIVSPSMLNETVDVVLAIADVLESNYRMKRRFEGLLCLSNPMYDLYVTTWDPSQRSGPRHGETDDWYILMTCVTRYFDQTTTVLDIATKHDLPFREVLEYLQRFRAKGLIEFVR